MQTETGTADELVYRRPARADRDGRDGILCVHAWRTGWQELVFASRADALAFAARESIRARGF